MRIAKGFRIPSVSWSCTLQNAEALYASIQMSRSRFAPGVVRNPTGEFLGLLGLGLLRGGIDLRGTCRDPSTNQKIDARQGRLRRNCRRPNLLQHRHQFIDLHKAITPCAALAFCCSSSVDTSAP